MKKIFYFGWIIILLLFVFIGYRFYVSRENNRITEPLRAENYQEAMALKNEKDSLPPEEKPAEKSVEFLFAGDMMFDRYVNHTFKDIGFDHIFDNFDKSLFANKNIAFANLEGPVSSKPTTDDYPERSLSFNMPPETINTIKKLGLNGVSLGNNHTLNAGQSGFLTTQSLLAAAGLKYGGSQNGFDQNSVIRFDTDIPVSIIAVDYLAFNNLIAINEKIASEKSEGRFVVVFPHWGEEYSLKHSSSQRTAAQKFIEAGANLIVGNHPHVIQDVEIINNVPVFYALGNFVFDQTFSKDTQEGLVLTSTLKENSLSMEIHPFRSTQLKPALMNGADTKIVLDRINHGQSTIVVSSK